VRVLVVLRVVGTLLRYFGLAFIPPALFAVFERDWTTLLGFVGAGLGSLALGTLMARAHGRPERVFRAEAMAIVAGTWIVVAAASAVPYLVAGLGPVDAMFESMSGLTTTGATVFTHFDYPRSLFLWRAETQWIGGLGVIALFVVVLPRLGIAGRQLFFAEASGAPSEGFGAQIRRSATWIWALYAGLTITCAVALIAVGMAPFDALCNAMATLSAGGFSPNGESILGYGNPGVEWVLIVFMFLAGASYPLQLRVVSGELRAFFRDGEFLVYLAVALLAVVLLLVLLAPEGVTGVEALRVTAFQVTSILSSTGFASLDYNEWQDPAKAVLIFVMVVGGCAGSAAGGPKVIRHMLVARHIWREWTLVLHPRAVIPMLHNGKSVSGFVVRSVLALVLLYFGGYLGLGLILTIVETDFVTAFSASLACMGNIGPGFGVVGPEGTYASFSPFAKTLLLLAMWVGRLEIITVLALLHPRVWSALRAR